MREFKDLKIAVAGTGYVGLSIAMLLSQHHKVTAVDIIPEKVELINNKKSPIQDEYIEKYLAEKELDLTATLDAKEAYSDADFVVIAAPTNYDSKKNFFDTSAVEAVIKLVIEYNPEAIICINIFGYMAAAYTTLVAYIVLAGAQIIFARKVHLKETGEKSVYNDKAVLFMAILTIMAALFGLVLYRYTGLRYIIICIGMIAGIKIALVALKKIRGNFEV